MVRFLKSSWYVWVALAIGVTIGTAKWQEQRERSAELSDLRERVEGSGRAVAGAASSPTAQSEPGQAAEPEAEPDWSDPSDPYDPESERMGWPDSPEFEGGGMASAVAATQDDPLAPGRFDLDNPRGDGIRFTPGGVSE
ncbi:MAG: hypothetical protein AAGA57_10595 [Planctomycetota bacterium]